MFNAKSQRAFSIVAGVCFSLLSLLYILYIISYIVNYIYGYSRFPYFSYFTLLYIGFSIIAFINKKALPFAIMSGLYTSIMLFNILVYIYQGISFSIIITVLNILAYSTLTFIALVNCIPFLHKNTKFQRYICFIPSALVVLSWIIQMAMGYYFNFLNLFDVLTESAALLFAGFWLVDESEIETIPESLAYNNSVYNDFSYNEPTYNEPIYNGYNTPTYSTPVYNSPSFTPERAFSVPPTPQYSVDDTEKLREYKRLLDEGVITQEEFNAKKRQILNL